MSASTSSRSIVVVVHGMILLTVGLLLAMRSGDGPDAWVFLMMFLPPLLAIGVAIAPLARKQRFIGFLLVSVVMVPPAGFGIFGGWGLLYIIGIIFLLFAAWQENEGAV